MGTILEITLVAPDAAEGRRVLELLYDQVGEIEAALTRFEPESAVNRLNRAAGSGPVQVPPVLARILSDSIAYSALTEGSFDVSVGPLIDLWTDAARAGRLPDGAMLEQARARVGWEKIAVLGPERVELPQAGMRVDFGGVAKGFALDRLAETLDREGIRDAFLSFGQSSIHTRGRPPDGVRWQLLLGNPGGPPTGLLRLGEGAASVSGSLGQWSEIEGRRYGHVIDPRSGRPLERAFRAAVLAGTAAEAEAWSKALLVLGERGIELLEAREGAEGVLFDESGGRHTTSGFSAAGGFEPLAP